MKHKPSGRRYLKDHQRVVKRNFSRVIFSITYFLQTQSIAHAESANETFFGILLTHIIKRFQHENCYAAGVKKYLTKTSRKWLFSTLKLYCSQPHTSNLGQDSKIGHKSYQKKCNYHAKELLLTPTFSMAKFFVECGKIPSKHHLQK